MNGIDPRLLGGNGRVMQRGVQQFAGGAVDTATRAELERLKRVVATEVYRDIQMLSKAIEELNGGTESGLAALSARIGAIERLLAQLTGAQVVHDETETREAANVQPGDENLPPEYFQGADEESAP
jgi:hypothetical protein